MGSFGEGVMLSGNEALVGVSDPESRFSRSRNYVFLLSASRTSDLQRRVRYERLKNAVLERLPAPAYKRIGEGQVTRLDFLQARIFYRGKGFL